MKIASLAWIVLGLALAAPQPAVAQSRLEHAQIAASSLSKARIATSPVRKLMVYLPNGYDGSKARYPVVYLLSNFNENESAPFTTYGAQAVFDQAIAGGALGPVIVVSADFSTPMGSSWFVNSPVTGNWQDFMTQELVPYIDSYFRTLAAPESRAVVGDRMGGYGAIRFGMTSPDVFGLVYALHPVGTGTGIQTMHSRPNWDRLRGAKSLADLDDDVFSRIFLSIYQAHLPNVAKPPLYVDLAAQNDNGKLMVDSAITARLLDNFSLERQLPAHADNLKRLRAFKFDWGRNDVNYDHVIANQAFARKLDEFGVPYEAEEYHGWWGERTWGADGRVMTDVVPFLERNLVFGR